MRKLSNKFHLRPEYLITVMLAKSILKNNIISTKISDFSLLLEDSTSNVFTRRFNEIHYGNNKRLDFSWK